MKIKIPFLFLCLFLTSFLFSQNLIKRLDESNFEGWQSSMVGNNIPTWVVKDNGKADLGMYWNDRGAIQSETGLIALVCDADNLVQQGFIKPTSLRALTVTSPLFTIDASPTVFLKFHQYYRNYESKTRVEVKIDGNDWVPFILNEDVGKNIETARSDVKIIDISNVVGNSKSIQIRFVFEGGLYFQIVNDIAIYRKNPFQTNPPKYSDFLDENDYPYLRDSSDWAIVPNEAIIKFKQGVDPARKTEIRDSLGARLVKSCACDSLELWSFGVTQNGEINPNGGTIGINSNVLGARADTDIDEVDYNAYSFTPFESFPPNTSTSLNTIPRIVSPSDKNVVKIAILDTGFDLKSPRKDVILANGEQLDHEDNNENCLIDDPVGWNYVDDNNNTMDDHSHGTHVAGIIFNNFNAHKKDEACEVRIIPYKTHDSKGVATLFNVICATYQASIDGANIINDSWGFYGAPSTILKKAIKSVGDDGVLVVAAAGNDTTDLAVLPQYPACYTNDNILTVGALVKDDQLADFSNYDNVSVDILAPGVHIDSDVPSWYKVGDPDRNYKTGTSMSAPAVTAAAAISYCAHMSNPLDVKNSILNCANQNPALTTKVDQGRLLNFDINCLTPTENIKNGDLIGFNIYPNPVENILMLQSENTMESIDIQLVNLTGQVVFSKKKIDMRASQKILIDVHDIPKGIYFIKIQQNDYIWSRKLLKL